MQFPVYSALTKEKYDRIEEDYNRIENENIQLVNDNEDIKRLYDNLRCDYTKLKIKTDIYESMIRGMVEYNF